MKYCPNTACPFLNEVGTVAEYEDNADSCLECGTDLIEGAAPELLPSVQTDERLLDDSALKTVVTVDSFSEAKWIKDELEQTRIAAKIVVTEPQPIDPESVELEPADPQMEATTGANDETDTPLFDVKVLAHHVVPAMDIINHLLDSEQDADFDEEYDDEEYGDEEYDDWEEDDEMVEISAVGNRFLLAVALGILVLVLLALAYGFGIF